MRRTLFAVAALMSLAVTGVSQNAQQAERKPVKPIRPFVVMTAQSVADVQQKLQPGNKVEELIGGEGMELRVAIQHEKDTAAANGEVHDASDDVYYVLDGSATLTLGGTLEGAKEIEPGEWRGPQITGGQKVAINKGDLIVVPRGTPHQRSTTGQNFTMILIKVFADPRPAPKPSPTSATPVTTPTPTPTPNELADLKAQLERAQTRLSDWPALARYREDNAKVTAPLKNELRVVFMGDSITDSWDTPSNGGFFPGKPYINRGISGQTTPQMLIRFRRDVIELKPRVVVILAGTNDLAGNTGPTTLAAIQDNLTTMAELARAHEIRVVFASLLPISDYEVRNGQPIIQSKRRPPEQIKALNEWMKAYAATHHFTYLDYFSAMVDEKGFLKDELSNDGLHPNPAGYAVMNPLAEAAIASSLKRGK
ncbi:MAG TPA: GDSL-type esterase/lipase family protein [Pyrinomonadaceae bacterium]|nr:GDSL-type esterase/lipase family protein [Pyrinomonadaceae bacterium]